MHGMFLFLQMLQALLIPRRNRGDYAGSGVVTAYDGATDDTESGG